MKNLFKLLSLLFIVSLVFTSCDDDSTSPSADYGEYMPMTIGSWWIQNTYESDATWADVELLSSDSVVVVGEATVAGRLAKLFVTYDRETGEAYDTSYQHFDKSKLSLYGELQFGVEDMNWREMLDFNKTSKVIFDTTLQNIDFEEGTFNGTLKYNYTMGANQNLTLKGASYPSKVINYLIKLNGSVIAMGIPVATVDVTGEINTYFAKNIGQAQSLQKMTQKITAFGQVNTTTDYIKTVIVDWNIK